MNNLTAYEELVIEAIGDSFDEMAYEIWEACYNREMDEGNVDE